MTFMTLQPNNSVGIAEPPVTFDWSLAFEHRVAQLALAYWKSRCAGRSMPQRSDLTPGGMSEFLANVALIESLRVGQTKRQYRVRLAGTRVEQIFGPIGGKSISEVLTEEIEARWRSYFDAVCDAVRPLRICGRVAFENKIWLESEALIAPLGQAGEPVTMLFAALAAWPAESVSKASKD